ncbi:type IV-A pilus assembly ATPase PilB [Persicimonas caeni]|uniref:Type IV-A pilus assembly ATPase PilB n=1 Tax=Persicimonas caeni TaxID=2292766 RepID=A0A4Y6PNP5_PERCE|nr:type IV-A pilus assembly ATPase PilB [Persicimonas caeni]QDG49932.1 type IV-A pilus assembly ATPase PilB [Persicimonas caeni]QED31153.1 type IV-A pilus assembly ATPase PilB [Persicimonas caeni]
MSNDSKDRLGELLLREKVISPEQLRKAQQRSKREGNRLGYELTRLGYVDEGDLTSFLSKHYGVPSVSLAEIDIPENIIQLIPREVAERHQCMPVNRSGATLVVAMADPSNIYAIDDLKFMTGYNIEVVVASESAIEESINQYYGAKNDIEYDYDEILGDLDIDEVDYVDDDDGAVDVNDLASASEDAPVIRLVNLILVDAIKRGASDIHIEPYEKDFRVRFRVDGVLDEVMRPPIKLKNAITSRIKIMSNLDIAERRLPQDGRIKLRMGRNREMDFRVSVLPTLFGEKIVLRLLDKSNLQLDMTKLGFEPEPLRWFKTAIHQPYGMCLVTGPTGSGKTTTLYSALSELNQVTENISTAEDPVEFNLQGINQCQMQESIGLNFAAALRSFLRQDPDIVMVGEIRDFETAEISIKAALTGHMVLSTLHTNDAPSTINRLLNMGIEPFLVTSALNVIVAQRLARRICQDCKEPFDVPKETLIDMQVPEDKLDATIYHGRGCQTCGDSGYKGRVAFYEILRCNDELKEYILQGYSTAELKAEAIRMGMDTLRMAGIKKMLQGITTPEEVVRNTAPDG